MIVNKYNNSYHRKINMKPLDVSPSMYIDFNKEITKFKVGNEVIISNYKNIFAKGNVPYWSQEAFCD